MSIGQQIEIIDAGVIRRSDVLPSVWAEERRILKSGETKRSMLGPFRYRVTPYMVDIVNCWHPAHPAREVWLMGGAQIGKTKGVIENGICYMISEHPGNLLYLLGNSNLVTVAGMNLDAAIDGTGIGHLIRSGSMRRGAKKTGDTDFFKEYAGGKSRLGSATKFNEHRQFDAMYGIYDDYSAAKLSNKEVGDTTDLILQRHAMYWDERKAFFISSPQQRGSDNTEAGYLRGDQRRFYIPCPKCGEMITLEFGWDADLNVSLCHGVDMPAGWGPADGDSTAGIYWQISDSGNLIESSVGYVCQACGNWFDDREKVDWLNMGVYQPTAQAVSDDVTSFHVSSLYAPPGAKGWLDYVRQYLKACPPGMPKDRAKFQVFVNVGLGMSYLETEDAPDAKALQRNVRGYDVGVVPDRMSVQDGNGRVVMLTLAVDLNGLVKDARVDWEVRAWSVSGSSYSVDQGSIGTFVPLEGRLKDVAPRKKWTYEHGKSNSVWPELTKVLETVFATDAGQTRQIALAGIDCGHYSKYAYEYLDNTPDWVIGLRGNKPDEALPEGRDVPWYKQGHERNDYWLLDVNRIKDRLSELMAATWDERKDEHQPAGFMNFPTPRDGKYSFTHFFEHYESEHRVLKANSTGTGTKAVWEKVNSTAQNHFFDTAVYNLAMRELHVFLEVRNANKVTKGPRIETMPWREYAELIVNELPALP